METIRLRYAQRFCLQRCSCVVGSGRWAQTQKQLRLVIDGNGTVVFSSIERSYLLVASRSVAQWSVAQGGVHVQSPIWIFFLAWIYDVNVEEGVCVKTHYRLKCSSRVARLQWQRLWVLGICVLRLAVRDMNYWMPCMYTECCFDCEYESCSGLLCTAVRCFRCHIVNSC